MAITNIIDLYISPQEKRDYYLFYVNQGDFQSRTIQANLYIVYERGGSKYEYTLSDETVTVLYEYTDTNGEIINTDEFECTKVPSIGDNVVTFIIPNIALTNYGEVKAQVRIYENETTLLNSVLFKFYSSVSLPVGSYEDSQLPLITVITYKGDYNPATTYQKGDVVLYNGSSYLYINAESTAGNLPTDDTYWGEMASGTCGSVIYGGTAITGTNTTPTAYPTGITLAIISDRYLYNGTDEDNIGNLYVCTLGGDDSTALWAYETNIRGAEGVRGSLTYSGTAITGTSTTPTTYSTGITDATPNDRYQYNGTNESDIGNVYKCTVGGDDATALWIYDTNIRGELGAEGTRGSLTYSGTAITGTSTTPTAYSTGITLAIVNDRYQYNGTTEIDIGNVYKCTLGGDDTTALWIYDTNIRGEVTLLQATETELGGVKAATKTVSDTLEIKIDDTTAKLYTTPTEIIDNLTSTSTTSALSANQGKILEDGKVSKSTYNANTVLYATTDDIPVALTVGEQTVIGRVTGGEISTILIDSDLSDVSASDDTIPSAKATKTALDGKASLVTSPTENNFASLTATGDLADSGYTNSSFSASSHVHGNITNDGKVGSIADLPVFTGTDGIVETKTAANARTALGLGDAATKTVGTSEGNLVALITGGKLPTAVIPSTAISEYVGTVTSKTDLVTISAAEIGDYAIVSGDATPANDGTYILNGTYSTLADWVIISTPNAVSSVNGYTGVVSLTASDVGAATTSQGELADSAMQPTIYDPTNVSNDAFDMDNMAQGTTNKYVSAAEKTVIENTSGTNTGDQDLSGLVEKSTYDANTILYATTDNTPAALTVGEQTVVGRVTGGNISAVSMGIADNNVVQMDDADAAASDYAKFTAAGLEGRSYAEVRADLDLETGIDVQGLDYTSVSDVSNVFACDVDSKRAKSFAFTIADTTAKTITFSNVPTGRCEVFLEITASATASATWTLDGGTVHWLTGITPTLISGKTHYVLAWTNDSGTNWTVNYMRGY